MRLNTSFDVRTDAGGKDPDTHSPTLRRYHRALWSKPLPNGAPFDLSEATPTEYLHHLSDLGEFWLTSDSAVPTFTRWLALRSIPGEFPEHETEAFRAISSTVGATLLFPSNPIGDAWTINQARSMNRKIADRIDLTLECIRRHYAGQSSPLRDALERYNDFFALFGDFHGYVDFFLLNDLIEDGAVRFLMEFDDFSGPSVPRDADTYREYRRRSIEFVTARNRRIDALEIEVENSKA